MDDGRIPCQELVELVTDYLEESLSPELRAACEGHLEACTPCRAYLDQIRGTIRAFGALIGRSTSPAVQDELIAVFQAWKRDRPGLAPAG
jgi:anti-sigma factor RsiW